MLRHALDMKGYELDAIDENFGKVKDFYFDDVLWTARYLVADTGNWLVGRKVLISPSSLRGVDEENEKIIVDLTKDKIKDSPPITADIPVSRQAEVELTSYYGWPSYWETDITNGDPHLRSTGELVGYEVLTRDEKIGKVKDFILDDTDWSIRYVIVESDGRKVLFALEWIMTIDSENKEISVDVDKDVVKSAPVYNPDTPLNRNVETELFDYYKKKYYW